MAHEQGLTTLKITGRHTSPLHPPDWIAEVDYDQNQNQHQDEYYIDDEEVMIEAEIEDEELYDRSPIQSCKKKMEYQKNYKNMKKFQNKKILKFQNKKTR
jgi:hypothetical protein